MPSDFLPVNRTVWVLGLSLQLASVNGRYVETDDIFKHTHTRIEPPKGETGMERAKESERNQVMSGVDDPVELWELGDIYIGDGAKRDTATRNSWSRVHWEGKRKGARADETGDDLGVVRHGMEVTTTDGNARLQARGTSINRTIKFVFFRCVLLLWRPRCYTQVVEINVNVILSNVSFAWLFSF